MNIKTQFSAIKSKIKNTKRSNHNKMTKVVKTLRQLSVLYTHHGQITV